MNLENWLSTLLAEDVAQIRTFLNDEAALQFLIVWSLFESKCFNGFMKKNKIEKFVKSVSADKTFDIVKLKILTEVFHSRYQNKKRYKNLLHTDTCPEMDRLLGCTTESLTPKDIIFLATFTVYRYRNNIFHGNKGVRSWLKYKPQIEQCTEIMKILVEHAEGKSPSLRTAA